MDINEYQQRAALTDRTPSGDIESPNDAGMIVPLFGMAGEVGQLLSEYKKYLRDGEAHKLFKDRITEELGDILWYIANTATKFKIDLSTIADSNIRKCQDRWGEVQDSPLFPGFRPHFDDHYPANEQFPREFVYCLQQPSPGSVKVAVYVDGNEITTKLSGLTDNHYDDDGYRFHDVFHVAYAAMLGWSPILRRALNLKRRSNPKVDEVEDGGRAGVIEEGIAAYVFSYAKDHSFLEGLDGVSYEVLRAIKNMTSHLEVSVRTNREWEAAILKGFEIWRTIRNAGSGAIAVNLNRASIDLCEMPEGTVSR